MSWVKTGKRKKGKVLRAVGLCFIILGIVCLLTLAGIDMFIRPTLESLLEYKCRMSAERIISTAVFESFADGSGYDGLVSFIFDNEGRIAALNTDRAKINSLKALLGDAVNDGLERLEGETVSISAGTLSGISFLYGTGKPLVFRLEPKGRAETQLKCSFESAGINQTIHSIILEVDAEISPMMPLFEHTVSLSYDILLTQTVIVGNVPGSYSHIVLDEEHLSEIADIDI